MASEQQTMSRSALALGYIRRAPQTKSIEETELT